VGNPLPLAIHPLLKVIEKREGGPKKWEWMIAVKI
jgi:hypothetical protein